MLSVSSTEAAKHFGRISRKAIRHSAVEVTNHGEAEVMVVAVEEYRRLKALDRQVFSAQDLPADLVEAIRESRMPAEAAQYSSEVE